MRRVFLIATTLFCSFNLFANEIVTNSKGEEIKLLDNGKWERVSRSDDEEVTKFATLMLPVENGDGSIQKIKVIAVADSKMNRPLKAKELTKIIQNLSMFEKIKQKNQYSYKPRKASFNQLGDILMVDIRYTSANSYGADVEGLILQKFKLNSNNVYKLQPES